jgi:tryptophan halogenase
LFRGESWLQVMIGQRVRPRSCHHLGRLMEMDRLRVALDSPEKSIGGAVARRPTHRQFLGAYCAAAGK